MFETLKNVFRVKEMRRKLLYVLWMILVIRIGSQLPVPGVDSDFFKEWFAKNTGDAFNFFDAFTGGSFTQMSIFALNITPYITSSIIMQLLTIAIPALEEMQRDGEEGRKKITAITRYVTVGLALFESVAMAIGFGRQGLIPNMNFFKGLTVVACLTAGSAMLMWIGERITDKGVGNGISIVLLFNIVSSLPEDVNTIYTKFLRGKNIGVLVTTLVIILAVVIAMVVFVVILQDGERRIPVQYSKKMVGRKMVGGQASNIPLKVNTAGVMPVIFASSIMSFPVVIAQFFKPDYTTIPGKILMVLNSSYWFRPEMPAYSVGLVIYLVLIVLFAYFYTSITFNPLEVANNMKKSGGFIPGVRPGKPTSDYIQRVLSKITLVGAFFLGIIAIFPIALNWMDPNLSSLAMGGTTILIVVSVALETVRTLESEMMMRHHKGFLE